MAGAETVIYGIVMYVNVKQFELGWIDDLECMAELWVFSHPWQEVIILVDTELP